MKPLKYYHPYLHPSGVVVRVASLFAHRPCKADEIRMIRRNNYYGPWIVCEYLSPSHPAYETAHESNKDKFSMASLPECSTTALDKMQYLGSVSKCT